jgi:peptidoglycan hydrolase-like protein with peptidoglycan-binding domain
MNIPAGLLRYGSQGQKVRDLQRELNSAGFHCGAVDGIFGSHTRSAVVAF